MTLKLDNRRVVKMGNSLMLTLPPTWTTHHKLTEKDLLEITITDDEQGRLLILKPLKHVQDKTDTATT